MKEKPTINPNDLMLVSRTQYNNLKQANEEMTFIISKYSQQHELDQHTIDNLKLELEKYKKFFKNFQNLLDDTKNIWYN